MTASTTKYGRIAPPASALAASPSAALSADGDESDDEAAAWSRLDAAAAPHRVTWQWVKGHAGHPDNERVDVLARTQAERFRGGAAA